MTCLEEYRKCSIIRCDISQSQQLLDHLKPEKKIAESPPVALVKVALKRAVIDISC